MYETWFRFTRRPFSTAPQLSDYFAASAIEVAGRTVSRCVQRGTGPALLIGPPGTGKTVLCMKLHASFASRMPTANICCAGLSDRRTLLQSLLFEFGRPYRQLDDGELRLSLVEYLTNRDVTQHGALLILDDAQHLPTEAIDEVRMLSNLVRNGKWCAHLVLVGTTSLEESLHGPNMESFQQRIAARCYLEPFRREETVAYLRQCLNRANSQPEAIFTEGAIRRIHDHSQGVPRLINQICDHALILAAAGHHRQLDGPGIDEAWCDLQQLPTPTWDTPTIPLGEIVQFGTLGGPTEEFDEIRATPRATEWQDENDQPEYDNSISLESTVDAFAKFNGEIAGATTENEIDGPSEFEPDADAQLAQIEESLNALSLAMTAGPSFEPSSDDVQPVPKIIPFCENPFLDDFESEELVIDRMGTLKHKFVTRQPSVTTDEGRLISHQLYSPTSTSATEAEEALDSQRAPDNDELPDSPISVEPDSSPWEAEEVQTHESGPVIFPAPWTTANPWQQLDVPIITASASPAMADEKDLGDGSILAKRSGERPAMSAAMPTTDGPRRRFQNLFGSLKTR